MTTTSSYIAGLMAKCPPGSVRVHGDCPRRLTNNPGARMGDTEPQSAPAAVGHNSGETTPMPEHGAEPEKLVFLAEQIAMVIAAQRATGMAPNVIGRLGGINRVKALRNSFLLNAVRLCRRNPLADTRLAILAYVTFLSDNPFGTCRLSFTRMCRLFKRSRETIGNSIADLEADGLIGVTRKDRSASIYWPVVHPEMVAADLNPAWIAPALTDPNWSRRVDQSEEETGQGDLTSSPEKSGQGNLTSSGNLVKDRRATGQGSPGLYLSNELAKDSLSSAHADGVSATEDLFPGEDPYQGGANWKPPPPVTGGSCKPAPSTSDIKLAFSLYLETAARCGLPMHERVDPWVPNIKARLREHGIDGWKRMLAKVEASPFLRGERTKFRANLDWLSGPKNFAKAFSGAYDDQHKPKPKKLTRY